MLLVRWESLPHGYFSVFMHELLAVVCFSVFRMLTTLFELRRVYVRHSVMMDPGHRRVRTEGLWLVEPKGFHTVVISTQHTVPNNNVRLKECAGYSGENMTAPNMEEMNKLMVLEVNLTLEVINLKHDKRQ